MKSYIDLANEVVRSNIHLADSYEDYTKLAFSLSTLGEQGRNIFHSLCSYCTNYNAKDADRKFTEALRNNRSYSIATFIWMCEQAGMDVKRFGSDSDNYISMKQSLKFIAGELQFGTMSFRGTLAKNVPKQSSRFGGI